MGEVGGNVVCLNFNGSHKLSLVVGFLMRIAYSWASQAGHSVFDLQSLFNSRALVCVVVVFVIGLVRWTNLPPKVKN